MLSLQCSLRCSPSSSSSSFIPRHSNNSTWLSSRSPAPLLFAVPAGAVKRRPLLVTSAAARVLRPVEERFKIQVEKNVDKERLEALGVQRWSKWESDDCAYEWEWTVDEQVYIVKGALQVTPEGCQDSAWFYAGDLVRFPKWLIATLAFDGVYEQRYRFRAYGDEWVCKVRVTEFCEVLGIGVNWLEGFPPLPYSFLAVRARMEWNLKSIRICRTGWSDSTQGSAKNL